MSDLGSPNSTAAYDENGVDLTLVRYTLGQSPTQRLKAVENYMKAMASVKPISPSRTK